MSSGSVSVNLLSLTVCKRTYYSPFRCPPVLGQRVYRNLAPKACARQCETVTADADMMHAEFVDTRQGLRMWIWTRFVG